ncbi:MAG: hypothetical protein V4440_05415 [Pseudomonadota bacterium]
MTSAAQTAAGSKLYVSATLPATYDAAGFEALTWTEVGEVTEIPAFGKSFNVVNHNPLGTRQTIKRKGSYDNGSIEVPYAYDITTVGGDDGQALLLQGLETDSSYAFYVDVKQLKALYFSGQVTSAPVTIGSVDSIITKSTMIAIDNDVVEADAP